MKRLNKLHEDVIPVLPDCRYFYVDKGRPSAMDDTGPKDDRSAMMVTLFDFHHDNGVQHRHFFFIHFSCHLI